MPLRHSFISTRPELPFFIAIFLLHFRLLPPAISLPRCRLMLSLIILPLMPIIFHGFAEPEPPPAAARLYVIAVLIFAASPIFTSSLMLSPLRRFHATPSFITDITPPFFADADFSIDN